MDAWSNAWTEDDTQQTPSSSKRTEPDERDDTIALEKPASTPFASFGSFDASDPWSSDAATPAAEPSAFAAVRASKDDAQRDETNKSDVPSLPSPLPQSSAWRDYSTDDNTETRHSHPASPPVATPQPSQAPLASPARKQSLSSYDPWAADSSATWGLGPQPSTSTLPTSEPDFSSSSWGGADTSYSPAHELASDFSSTHIDAQTSYNGPYASEGADATAGADEPRDDTGTNLDAWAAEASSREEKARRLDRGEIDKLKVDARKLIASVNTEADTQAGFADPSSSDVGWADLFGSQGTQREKLHHLQSPPSALLSSSGALRTDIVQSSPATLNQVRSAIAKTENMGVKLASLDNTGSWQRGSRPITKADWLPDALTADADSASLGKASAGMFASKSNSTSGPGWMQTSSNDARSSSGPSFLASFFKSRQASSASGAGPSEPRSSQEGTQAYQDGTSPPTGGDSPAMSASSHFEPYQDSATTRYSDDPTGPDLMSLDTSAPAPSGSAAHASAAPAQAPGFMSRWRNSGLFRSSSTKKANPSWASGSLGADDLDWLGEQDSSDSKTSQYRYDEEEDDSFASFQNTDGPKPSQLQKAEAPTSKPSDPFDNLFGPPPVQKSLSSAAPSSARSSLSATRMSGEGGMMTISTNLGRANSLVRTSAASPLQPPPQSQHKRFSASVSIPPPPRANAGSPGIIGLGAGQQQKQTASDPFADFLTDAPAQQSAGSNVAKGPPATAAVKGLPTKASNGGGLTADDLLFFDSL